MTNHFKHIEARRAMVFILWASLAALICYTTNHLIYMAPLMATAAVLANAGDQIKQTLLATITVYFMSMIVATIGAYLLPVNVTTAILCCGVAYTLCQLFSRQHPPALAMLSVYLFQSTL